MKDSRRMAAHRKANERCPQEKRLQNDRCLNRSGVTSSFGTQLHILAVDCAAAVTT